MHSWVHINSKLNCRYKSLIFELIVQSQEDSPELPNSNSATKEEVKYFVHKEITASMSPELHNRIYNTMREGETNSMILVDVDEERLQFFFKWIYGNEDNIPLNAEDGITGSYNGPEYRSSRFLVMKIYIFDDRFNIADLQIGQ